MTQYSWNNLTLKNDPVLTLPPTSPPLLWHICPCVCVSKQLSRHHCCNHNADHTQVHGLERLLTDRLSTGGTSDGLQNITPWYLTGHTHIMIYHTFQGQTCLIKCYLQIIAGMYTAITTSGEQPQISICQAAGSKPHPQSLKGSV